jgi:type IV pilus assembly protein PilW
MGAAVSFPPRRRLQGFTLVELLVSIAIGMVVMVALIAVYLNVSRTNSEMGRTNSMVENGRFAIDVLNDDVSHAGFWAGWVPQFDNYALRSLTAPAPVPADVPTAAALALGPCNAYASWTGPYRDMLLGIPVEVYQDAAPTGCDTTSLIKDRKAGTDVLVVRHVETCIPSDLTGGSANCEASNAGKVYFQRSYCSTDPATYYLQTGPIANFTLHKRDCTTVAPIYKFDSNIYYVRTWSTTSGDGVPTLVRTRFNLDSGGLPANEVPAQALIEGVEKFHVELGVDNQQSRCAPMGNDYTKGLLNNATTPTLIDPSSCSYNTASLGSNTLPVVRGDGVPDGAYVYCPAAGCTAAQLMDVTAVKLYVVARSRDPSPGFSDDKTYALGSAAAYTPATADKPYKRHLFSTAIRLTNISGRRETP